MSTINNKRFAVCKALANIKIATISNHAACFLELCYNLFRSLLKFFICLSIGWYLFFTKVIHNLLDYCCLQYVRNVNSLSKLCDQCRLAHALCSTNNDDKWDFFLVKAGDELISLHEVLRVAELRKFLEKDLLQFNLCYFHLVLLNKVLLNVKSNLYCVLLWMC